MTKDEVRKFFESKGFKADHFGHYIVKKPDGRVYRYKMGLKTLRYETKMSWGGWHRLRSGFYGHLTIGLKDPSDGRTTVLKGMTK